MSRILVLTLMMSTFAFASGHEGGTDIVQRTVNFLLFVGLVWYLVAEPAKNFFASRSNDIANELKSVQDKLNQSVSLKKEALAKISEAEKYAEELAAIGKKENKMINDSIMAQCEIELENIVKHEDSVRDFEQRKMISKVVEDILTTSINQSSDGFDKEAMANVILKKVA